MCLHSYSGRPAQTRTRSGSDGFTLVELVIALAVGILIVLAASAYTIRAARSSATRAEQASLDDARELVSSTVRADFMGAGRYLARVSAESVTAPSYVEAVRTDRPLAWWRFNELTNGSVAADATGNNNVGIFSGGVTPRIDGALASEHDAAIEMSAGARITVNGPAFPFSSDSFSVEWWLKPTHSGSAYGQTLSGGDWGNWVFRATGDGAIDCGTDSATSFSAAELPAGTLRAGEWQHLVYTYDRGTASLYHNGRLLAAKPQTRPLPWGTFILGATLGEQGSPFWGGVDEAALYAHALPLERVRAHYVAGVAPRLPSADGLQTPLLPLVRWEDGGFTRPDGVIHVSPTRDLALILAADEDFTPTPTRSAFSAADPTATLVVRRGMHNAPIEGDFLLVVDFDRGRSVLIRVTGATSEFDGSWSIPVAVVEASNPAWGMLASPDEDVQLTMPAGSSVVRLAAPTVYYTRGGRLIRAVGAARDILAFGATSFRVERDADTENDAWLISFELEGEAVEASSDPNWNQRAAARFSVAPAAMNPGS